MDTALQKEQTRERVKRYRNKQKALQNTENLAIDVTFCTGNSEALQKNVTPHNVYQSIMVGNREVTPAILDALVEPAKRQKLEKIYESLKSRGLANEVYYGISGIIFADIGELLEATG